MVFVGRDGTVQQSKSFGIQSIPDFFWGIIGFFVLFFRTLFHMDEPSKKGQYGSPSARAPAWPRRRMGGFASGSAPSPPPCAPGGG